jgi:hypothetical protein
MSNQIEKEQRIRRVAILMEQGHSRENIIAEYAEKWSVTDRTIDRYIAFAKDIVASKMDLRDSLIEALRADIIATDVEKWLKSNLEIEARLCSIMEGTLETEKVTENEKGEKKITRSKPSHSEIIRAIDKLCKMRGMYDPKVRKSKRPVIIEYNLQREEDLKLIQGTNEQKKL